MNPYLIQTMGWAMSDVYASVTDALLVNLARHFRYISQGAEVPASWEYQVRKLAEVGQVRKESVQIILDKLGDTDGTLRGMLIRSIEEGLKDADPALRKAAEKGLLTMMPPTMSANQMQAFKAFYNQASDKLNLVNTVMLQSTQAAYTATVSDIASKIKNTQGILNAGAGRMVTGVDSFNKVLHDSVRQMVNNGLTGFVDSAGRNWSPEAYVNMDMRTTMTNTAREAINEQCEAVGVDLYQVSWHDGARPMCYPWQGKVISRNGWTGETEDDEGNKVTVYAESDIPSFRYGGGLFGVNCGHYPIPFIPGFSRIRPPRQDEEQNAKEYAESQQQRYLERQLREEKRELAVMKAQGASDEQIQAQKERIRTANSNLETFCDETGRARQKYREYTQTTQRLPDTATPVTPSTPTIPSTPQTQEPSVLEQKVEQAIQANPEPVETQTPEPDKTETAYTPAKTIGEAEEYAKTFVDTGQWGSYGLSYHGVSVDTANLVNQKLSDFTKEYNIDKFGGIVAPAGNTRLGRQIEGAHAAYNTVNNSFVLNRKTAKTPTITLQALKQEKDFVTDYLKDPSKYPGLDKEKALKRILDASSTSGRATVPETLSEVLDHELGHALQKGVKSSSNFSIIEGNWKTWGEKISGYAQENINEYIAESFCAWRKGETIDPELIKAFEGLKR